MPDDTYSSVARCLAELGHAHRLQIFDLLVKAGDTGCSVGDVQQVLGIPKSTLSHHLAQLVAVDLITQTREGRTLRCRIRAERARLVQRFINACCERLTDEVSPTA